LNSGDYEGNHPESSYSAGYSSWAWITFLLNSSLSASILVRIRCVTVNTSAILATQELMDLSGTSEKFLMVAYGAASGQSRER
jgi:hypothetical protein